MTLDTRSDTLIRDATDGDLLAILDIHNRAIAETTAIWDEELVGLDERRTWLRERTGAGRPVLIAEVDGELAGYASYGSWRPKSGYRHTVENSVYVADRFHRRGIASALLTELIARARAAGDVHVMVAAIEAGNTGSIALHERFGFRTVGVLPQVGIKFGRWLDLTLMQLTIGLGDPASWPAGTDDTPASGPQRLA
ncbi:N-acetyltransferase [Nocardia cyriacigeorgica]|jgi:L-amino acid N-acyltransferase|uniref:GNAT family N-acetyltransferase n=1 Tax=Nocardia cyriacigeorgica TaxID=135487 RepID=UPI000CE9F803|nr:GNAT family N-acetyltransferase [Nocardia cyriacigeorgica]MBF6088879.1 N-acetyltransferase [Nocardia cyriacigeorgica]MBF6093469.1 N-acetyltransferase [Nocardia cyriacigeorgica]MBF6157627.1 N-acetyltransferase [Nocardia cyriacigeorgica]MBF6196598.1 N-acetyltransferase [Nocardia cyriacigeorgica]MBF6318149.1 N-acetyltransferase [Nocardia cyriacigeorgica]